MSRFMEVYKICTRHHCDHCLVPDIGVEEHPGVFLSKNRCQKALDALNEQERHAQFEAHLRRRDAALLRFRERNALVQAGLREGPAESEDDFRYQEFVFYEKYHIETLPIEDPN